MAADPIAALVAFLRADSPVTDLTGGRVFGGAIPEKANSSMPGWALVVRAAGGGGRIMPILRRLRVDTDCYGATEMDSWSLHLAVSDAIKNLSRVTVAGVLLHSADVSAEGQTGRDPQTNWPLTIASYSVLAAAVPAA